MSTSAGNAEVMTRLTAILLFYGFFFVLLGALTTITSYAVDRGAQFIFYVFLVLLALSQAWIGMAALLEIEKAGFSRLFKDGCYLFISAMPLCYIELMGQLLGYATESRILAEAVIFIGLIMEYLLLRKEKKRI